MSRMQKATERHFYFHGEEVNILSPAFILVASTDHTIRSFPTHADLPVTVVNEEDSQVLPDDFRFINNVVLGVGVEQAGDSFRSGCACATDSECQFTSCHCLADLEEDDSSDEESRMSIDEPRVRRKVYAYHAHGAKAGLLRSKFHDSKTPIYECHQSCSCSTDCPNRVVERGRTVPLEIFRTRDRGWGGCTVYSYIVRKSLTSVRAVGVRSPVSIKKGQFVDRYLGEIITSAEADRRRSKSAISQRKDVYLFALDKFTDPESLDPRLKGPPLEVDGEFMSGPTRFVNHSCEPNMRIFARVGDHADKHIHDLALFAIKDIQKGQELTFDYVDGVSHEGEEPDGDTARLAPYDPKTSIPLEDFITIQSHRTLRRTQFARRALIHRQFSLGRGNPSKVWCDDGECILECFIFINPNLYPTNLRESREGLRVDAYFQDFTEAMVSKLFGILDAKTKKHRIRGMLSFIDSPPVRATFGGFIRTCEHLNLKSTDQEFQKALVAAQPVFRDLMFGVKTAARIQTVHSYLQPNTGGINGRDVGQLILQFLVTCEIWRQHKTPRSESWKVGSAEGVSQFLTAMLFNYKLMWHQKCFTIGFIFTGNEWDQIWEQWLQKYPVQDPDEDVFEARNQLEKTEQEVLDEVGYLGGVGVCDDSYRPVRWNLGREDPMLLK
ncbi:hypothetical protein FGRMN_3656 [Fusarium graminum]|nr:hypothetical protein FGRMN_3656 [Fusarium graminum]